MSIVDPEVVYNPSYIKVPCPKGDVSSKTVVCTDVVIRAYRKLNTDIQKEVHAEMVSDFSAYPIIWGLKTLEANINHKKATNLEFFFKEKTKNSPYPKRQKTIY